jgi:uncharacterized membrane protein YedE/YeeE
MALTGACPGTVLPQLATGIPSAVYVLLGAVSGGILYSKFGRSLILPPSTLNSTTNSTTSPLEKDPKTLDQLLQIDPLRALAIYESILLGIVAVVGYLKPDDKDVLLPGAVGGLLIGGSQFASLALTRNTLGVSGAYEQAGDLFWWVVSGMRGKRPSVRGVGFVVGSVGGAFVVGRLLGLSSGGVGGEGGEVVVGAMRALLGGVLLTFGSRVAGGCTSGHGISGMSLLSLSSFVSVGAMFAGGMGLAAVLKLLGSQ